MSEFYARHHHDRLAFVEIFGGLDDPRDDKIQVGNVHVIRKGHGLITQGFDPPHKL
jgi:hypothetical protein